MNRGMPKQVRQYIAALVASLTCVSAGTALGWSGQVANDLLDGKLGYNITYDQLEWIGWLMYIGAAVMSLFTGAIADATGRKPLMLFLVIPSTVGWCLLIWANSVAMLYCGRIITGMVAGAFTVLSVMYTMEIAQKEIRGALGSFTPLMITVGFFFSYALPIFLDYKYYTACCAAMPLVFAVLFSPMPETPIYLLKTNKPKQAYSTLRCLREESYDVEREFTDMQDSLEEEVLISKQAVVVRSLKTSTTKNACFIGFGLMFFKPVCGVDSITAFTVYIFSNSGIRISPNVCVMILISFQIIAGVTQLLLVDRLGRRFLLCFSGTVMTFCLTIIAVTSLLKDIQIITEEYYQHLIFIPIVAVILYCVSFALGIGPIPWVIMGEVFPEKIKSIAISIGTFMLWITAFLSGKLFVFCDRELLSYVIFFIFAVVTGASVIFVILLVPETKNKTLKEIQKDLE